MSERILDNAADNPCFGCGPAHPHGLRLQFREADGVVHASLVATPERQGWPGRLHSGILYLALLETANWTLYGTRGRVGVPTRTSALEVVRWVATGERLTLRGRLVGNAGGSATVEAEALDEAGRRVGRLERAFDVLEREAFLGRMGYDRLPAGLDDCFPS